MRKTLIYLTTIDKLEKKQVEGSSQLRKSCIGRVKILIDRCGGCCGERAEGSRRKISDEVGLFIFAAMNEVG